MAFRSLVMSILLALLFTWFALANSQVVTVSLMVWTFHPPLSILIFISILIGILFAGLISVMDQGNFHRKIKELESKLKNEEDLIKGGKN